MPNLNPASSWFALGLTGDLAGVTYVQNAQRRRIAYVKTWPKRKPTQAQIENRGRFIAAIANWRDLSQEQKHTLDKIAASKHMVMSGYNLYISCSCNQTLDWIQEWANDLNLPW